MTAKAYQLEKIITFRRELHRHPELSGQEQETARRVEDMLKESEPDQILSGLGGHGVAAVYRGIHPGPDLMFRCELDALPVREASGFDYDSLAPGISHKCGHDGHMAILAGIAGAMKGYRDFSGRLILLFQPAEETGAGAAAVVKDPLYDLIRPDFIFALHNWPGYPQGHLVLREGTMFSASLGLQLEFTGESAHAMAPEEGRSPIEAIKTLHAQLGHLHNPDKDSDEFSLITTVGLNIGGDDHGVSPGRGKLSLTLRAYCQDILDTLTARVLAEAEKTAASHSLRLDISTEDVFPETRNHPACVAVLKKAASMEGIPMIEKKKGLASSEDAGVLFRTARTGGAIFLLGNGEDSAPLHSFDYDFNDSLLESGIAIFSRIFADILKMKM